MLGSGATVPLDESGSSGVEKVAGRIVGVKVARIIFLLRRLENATLLSYFLTVIILLSRSNLIL